MITIIEFTFTEYITRFFRNEATFFMLLMVVLFSIFFMFMYIKVFKNKLVITLASLLNPIAIVSLMSFSYTRFSWIGWSLVILSLFFIGVSFLRLIAMSGDQVAETNKNKQVKEERKNEIEKMKNVVKCSNCDSLDVENLGNNKKSFSVGKAAAGGLLTGGIGTLAGFAGKKGKTDKWHCKNCGNVFDK